MVTSQKRLSLNVCYWCPINLFRVKTKAIVRGFAALLDYCAKSNTFVSFRPIIFQDNVDYNEHLVSTGNFDKWRLKKFTMILSEMKRTYVVILQNKT